MQRRNPQRRRKTPPGTHVPVLPKEVMACLHPAPGDFVVDCTVGYGGHARGFLQRITPGGRLIGLDVDRWELERTRKRLAEHGDAACLLLRSYAEIAEVTAEEGLDGFDVLFADLGVSSMQVDDPARGISYKHANSPLGMRMDERLPQSFVLKDPASKRRFSPPGIPTKTAWPCPTAKHVSSSPRR